MTTSPVSDLATVPTQDGVTRPEGNSTGCADGNQGWVGEYVQLVMALLFVYAGPAMGSPPDVAGFVGCGVRVSGHGSPSGLRKEPTAMPTRSDSTISAVAHGTSGERPAPRMQGRTGRAERLEICTCHSFWQVRHSHHTLLLLA